MTNYDDSFAHLNRNDTATPNTSDDESRSDGSREAVPTRYRDTMFRSALEATWAETLDRLGVVWEYEPEMVTLPSGVRYLPDFRLPAIGAWLEVKGDNIPGRDKAVEFARSLACSCVDLLSCECRWRGGEIVIIGHPPRIKARPGDHRRSWWANWSGTFRGTPWFAACFGCDTPGWTTSPRCRACKGPLAGHLIAAADELIEMAGR